MQYNHPMHGGQTILNGVGGGGGGGGMNINPPMSTAIPPPAILSPFALRRSLSESTLSSLAMSHLLSVVQQQRSTTPQPNGSI
jgi:hypothetical protein